MKYTIFILVSCLLFSSSIVAQSNSNELNNLRLTKIDNQGKEVAFTVSDAIQLVRFFNTQKGVKFCKSDPQKNSLRIVGDTGTDIQALLNTSSVVGKMSKMGYKMDFTASKNLAQPLADIPAKEDCEECGDVKVDKSAIDDMLDSSDYGGDVINISLDGGSGGSSSPFGEDGGSSDPFGNGGSSSPFSSTDDPFSSGGSSDFTMPQMSQSQIDSLQRLFNGSNKTDNK
ncbi:MAG: hypothetical protein ACPGVB_17035 [Chitinophagales bacterium]